MIKKINLVILIVILVMTTALFTGCSKKIMWVENSGSNYTKASYESFTGTDEEVIKAEEGETLVVDFESEVKKGNLSLGIVDPDGNQVLSLEPDTKGTKKIEITKSGKYALVIEGEKTGGSFNIKWSKE